MVWTEPGGGISPRQASSPLSGPNSFGKTVSAAAAGGKRKGPARLSQMMMKHQMAKAKAAGSPPIDPNTLRGRPDQKGM
jgi:hypothetical protein